MQSPESLFRKAPQHQTVLCPILQKTDICVADQKIAGDVYVGIWWLVCVVDYHGGLPDWGSSQNVPDGLDLNFIACRVSFVDVEARLKARLLSTL